MPPDVLWPKNHRVLESGPRESAQGCEISLNCWMPQYAKGYLSDPRSIKGCPFLEHICHSTEKKQNIRFPVFGQGKSPGHIPFRSLKKCFKETFFQTERGEGTGTKSC